MKTISINNSERQTEEANEETPASGSVPDYQLKINSQSNQNMAYDIEDYMDN